MLGTLSAQVQEGFPGGPTEHTATLQLYLGPCLTHHMAQLQQQAGTLHLPGGSLKLLKASSSHSLHIPNLPSMPKDGMHQAHTQHSKPDVHCPHYVQTGDFMATDQVFTLVSVPSTKVHPISSHTPHSSRLFPCGRSMLMVLCLRKVRMHSMELEHHT